MIPAVSSRERLFVESAGLTLAGAGVAFLLLALLHHQLAHPFIYHADLTIQTRVHAWSRPALTRVMLALSWVGSIKVFLPTLACAVLALLATGEKQGGRRTLRKREISTLFALAIGGALELNGWCKHVFHRPRPQVPWSIGDEHTWSFPSGHSLFSAVLYGLIAYILLKRRLTALRLTLSLAALLMPLAIGISRIYLGMHFPTDVLAGWMTGAIWLATTIAIDRRWQAHSVRTHARDAV